ncbi:HAD-like domain-containing protein [Aspergillus pseudonomiae]|uniref:HAD-like domain-containing protein n=1 Tax=Aspergillus pseudonomiae TaxID=1506151 RepID=A0A5N7CTE7_9EURO|nr:HAD-like domain-containing protein [Aspergillus pseudonomiae]KAE8397481.1 HAD-like domain-containing protein [Aspergillus pseudonomiae]
MPINILPKVLFFDVFGTVVEWCPSVTRELKDAAERALHDPGKPIPPDERARVSQMTFTDWLSVAEDWRQSYGQFTAKFDPSQGFVSVDQHHYTALSTLLKQRKIENLFTDSEKWDLSLCWHRLVPWPDSVRGLELLSRRFRTCTLSNGNVSLLEDLQRYGSLPFTDIASAENFGAYKPSPQVYRGAAARFDLDPSHCALVAAHLSDLKAAKAQGFQTIYVARSKEETEDLSQAKQEGYSTVTPTPMDTFGVKLRSFARPCPVILQLNFLPKKTAMSYTWGLEEIIQLVVLDPELGPDGWFFSGRWGSAEKDPLYGFTQLRQLYFKADPAYEGRYTIPVLWDKKEGTIVNNESSEIIRMFYTEFDHLLPDELREINRPGGGFYPQPLRKDIDEMNEWVYHQINNGVYKTGFATTQQAYEENIYPLFEALDRVENHLAQPGHQPYLFGENITEADIRLYTTIARFDVAYYLIFRCNLKMIRHDYPRIHDWYRRLYFDESTRTRGGAFKKTTYFDIYKFGYLKAIGKRTGSSQLIIPAGPSPDILPLEGQ